MPWYVPNEKRGGICRFYLQEVAPNFRLYVSPLNMDPAAPALKMSEPESFITKVSERLGSFATTGFQEEYNARKNNLFDDEEYQKQANMVLEERLALFDYAVDDYADGLLFFYFSSSDLQSHMFWWEWERGGPTSHPSRDEAAVWNNFEHIQRLYQRLDQVVGDLMDRYGSKATIFVMSDHGFANFGRQFNLEEFLAARRIRLPRANAVIVDPARRRLVAHLRLRTGNQRPVSESQGPRAAFRHRRAGRRQADAYLAELKERLEAKSRMSTASA